WPSTPPGRSSRAGEVSSRPDDHRWARTGPARPVDNGGGLAADGVAAGPKGRAGPVEPANSADYAAVVDERDGSRLRLPVAILLAVVAGVLLDLSFPSPGWWPLAAAGVAVLALAVRGFGPG